jgi:tRNA-specific 2-thiouridylase
LEEKIKIAVAMSGGVDSSVAAALCVEKYGANNVFGVTMRLFCYNEVELNEKNCCSMDAIDDAKAVCDQLSIPHYAINLEKEFKKAVINDFVSEYKLGHTPIPCIPCNTVIKFDNLLKKVKALGADYLVTGHYARIEQKKDEYRLLKGVDNTKDQTYFLYGLKQKQLGRIMFPLGGMKKTEVRKLAKKFKLKTAEKRESQGICFITEGRVTDWMKDKVKSKDGNIIDTKGNILGKHEGIIYYTVGQRKRIGGGYVEPMYVVNIDANKDEVTIGIEKDLYREELRLKEMSWINQIKMPLKCKAKIRYNMEDEDCVVYRDKIIFKRPQRAITPGQSVVIYNKDVVLGGGIIFN